MKLSIEQLAKASAYSTPQKLVDAAAEAGIDCSIEQAEAFLRSNEMTELSEDDIELVSGGCEDDVDENGYRFTSGNYEGCPDCDSLINEWDSYQKGGWVYAHCLKCGLKFKYKDLNTR